MCVHVSGFTQLYTKILASLQITVYCLLEVFPYMINNS